MTRFHDKVAVVLGASEADSMGGIIAARLVAEGAQVVVASRRHAPVHSLAAQIGAVGMVCDITREAEVAALAEFAVKRFGGLDVAVNCAGEAIMGYIATTDEATLRRATDIHFIGPFFFIKQMAARMQRGGSIVTLSSITATLTFPNHAAYMGAKAGTDHLVRIAATEYGARGIKVNSVSPAFTETPMTAGFLAVPGVRESFEAEIPLGRLNTAADVAATVLWLSSDEAYLTGENIHPSGGNRLRRLPVLEL
jgi:2-hydroxycyclohexanecarboxyl-CoA dehydrogenase